MEQTFKKLTEDIKAKLAEAFSKKEFQEAVAETKAATDSGTFEVVVSTSDRDRQGDIVMQDGWVLDNYKSNPVVLWAHDYWQLPVGVCDEIKVIDGKLVAKGRFAEHEFAQEVRKLHEAGMLPATSVGFIPLETEGNVILRAELLEFSFVPVPANPMALSLAQEKQINLDFAFAKGIMTKEVEATETPATEEPAAEVATDDTTTPPAAADNDGAEPEPTGGDTEENPSPQPEADKPEGSGEGAGVEPEPVAVVTPVAEEIAAEPDNKAVVEKAGRVLSDKNRTLISNTLANLKDSVAALEELLTATEPEGSDSQGTAGKAEAVKASEIPQGFADVKAALEAHLSNREVLRMVATSVTRALENLNTKRRTEQGK